MKNLSRPRLFGASIAFIVASCAGLALCRRVRKSAPAPENQKFPPRMGGEPEDTAKILRKNSVAARTYGNVFLMITIFIGLSITTVFVYANEASRYVSRSYDTYDLAYRLRYLRDSIASANAAAGDNTELKNQLAAMIEKKFINGLSSEEQPEGATSLVAKSLSGSVIRIGAVLVGVFLIQIMVGFTRYFYRLAEHLRMSSLLILLSDNDVSVLSELVPLLLPRNIDFGKMPTSPFEKIAEGAVKAAGELAKKVPGAAA